MDSCVEIPILFFTCLSEKSTGMQSDDVTSGSITALPNPEKFRVSTIRVVKNTSDHLSCKDLLASDCLVL